MQMLKAYAKDFWRYRYLLQNLIGRDFKLKYRRSVLGVVCLLYTSPRPRDS